VPDEGGLKALEWFEQQTQGKSDQALLTASQSGHKQSSKPSVPVTCCLLAETQQLDTNSTIH
jgi:hypothetical protein